MKQAVRRWALAGMAAVLLVAVGAWLAGRSAAPAGAPDTARTPSGGGERGGAAVSVTTVKAQRRDVPVQLDATGTVVALTSVEVRPQVGSVIRKVHVREGQFVRAGELLFTLDARTLQAALDQARAQLKRDQASLADAQRQLRRSRELLAQGFVAQGALDSSRAQVEALSAVVAASRAAVQAATVNLQHSRIVAPSAGRTGAITVAAGTTVQANTTPLVTLTQLDPIAVQFNLPQRHLADALQALSEGGGSVSARLPDSNRSATGTLQFVDSLVDAASGTVKVKALFANPDQALWPGAYVNVRMAVRTLKDAVVVPQATLIIGARGRSVYVVDGEGRAALRAVELVHAAGADAVVTGVQAGERVVVEGRQNLRPGVPVVEHGAAGGPEVARAGDGAAAGERRAAQP